MASAKSDIISYVARLSTEEYQRPDYYYLPVEVDTIFLRSIYLEDSKTLRNQRMRSEYLQRFDALQMYNDCMQLRNNLASLKLQNHVLLDFIEQNDPKLLPGLHHAVRSEKHKPLRSMHDYSMHSSFNSTRPSASTATGVSAGKRRMTEVMLNYKAKASMAEKFANSLIRRLRESEKEHQAKVREMRLEIRELVYQKKETEQTEDNFLLHMRRDRDDVIFLETAPERQILRKLRKFTKSWHKAAANMLSNIRIAISTAESRSERYRADLISKSDMKGILTSVDFEKLLIMRKEMSRMLNEKNRNVAGIKSVSGRSSMELAEQKRQLDKLESHMSSIERRIREAQRTFEVVQREVGQVHKANEKDLELHKQMRNQLELYVAPAIGDYVELKALYVQLCKEERVLQRKLNIANMKLRNARKFTHSSIF